MGQKSPLTIYDNIRIFGEQRHRWHPELDMFPEISYDRPFLSSYPNVAYPSIPVASDNVIWGIDISGYYDGIVNWQTFKNRGGQFCVIKIADGTVKTKYADENVDGALNAGLVVLGYCWLYRNIRISGNAQGTAWSQIAKSLGVQGVSVDYEWTYWNGVQDNPDPSDLYGAVIPFENAFGSKPMIYSAPGFMGQMPAFWKDYKLWIAQYGVLKPNAVVPWGANGHTFWQITDRWDGSQLGVDPLSSKAEDGDLFNGTQDEFNTIFGGVTPIPDPPPGGNVIAQYDCTVVSTSGVKVRPDNSTSNNATKTLSFGARFQASELVPDRLDPTNASKLWAHIAGGTYDGQYCAVIYNGTVICTYEAINPVPPPPPVTKNLVGNVTFKVTDTDTGDVYGASLTDVPLTKQ